MQIYYAFTFEALGLYSDTFLRDICSCRLELKSSEFSSLASIPIPQHWTSLDNINDKAQCSWAPELYS